jgi:uncharacterized SAM-binding protein YcdF (DUF218 family)
METLFFWLSKLVWAVVAPEGLLVLLVVGSWVLVARNAIKWARRVLGFTSIALLVLAWLPVGEWVLYPLEERFAANPPLPKHVDGIIVLGGAEDAARSAAWDQAEVNDSADRFFASIALSRAYPQAKLVFTSGSGNPLDQKHTSADVARKLYAEQGLDVSRIVFEGESRNTAENVARSKSLVKPSTGEVWVMVTSAFHMPRSIGIFCQAGWPVIAYPVDHKALKGNLLRASASIVGNLGTLSLGIKEWLGLAAYYMTGRIGSAFPAGCAS